MLKLNFILFYLFCLHFDISISAKAKRAATICKYGTVFNGISCDACSNSYFAPNIKIVGGIPAVPNSWPAQILLIVDKSIITPGLYGKCGGTIVDRYTVVTAAHCLIQPTETYNGRTYTIANPLNPTAYKVYAGAHNIDFTNYYNADPTAPTVRLQVKKVIQHPSYNAINSLNDIAIFQLAQPITMNKYVQPACMPNPSYGTYPSNTNIQPAYACGWGTLTSEGSSPSVLYNVKLNSYPFSYCSIYSKTNQNSQICGGDPSNRKDTCQGDSGGGFYSFDSNIQKFIFVGIVSYGDGCGSNAGIYTRVSFYYSWISGYMESPNSISPIIPTPSSGVSTAVTASSPISTSSCYDVNTDTCPGYASKGYCGQLISINQIPILKYCQKSCNACNVVTTKSPSFSSSSLSKDCYNNGDDEECSYYEQSGYCFFDTIKSLCAASCKACNQVTTSSAVTCTDIDTSCAFWANLGLCSYSSSVFPTYCKKSCKRC